MPYHRKNSPWSRIWLTTLGLVCAPWLSTLGGCGARTGLPGGTPCGSQGAERPCQNGCGSGVLVCEDGYWSECRVETTTRACANTCGSGTQSCESTDWSVCRVEPVERACENSCGEGTQLCADDQLGACLVERREIVCASKCGTGSQICEDDTLSSCTAPQPLPPTLRAIVRDFRVDHPDFESDQTGLDPGMVEPILGMDDKPVYSQPFGSTPTTTGRANFDQWYRDVPGVNLSTEIALPLGVSAGDTRLYVYSNPDFFPIDNALFGNEGNPHNFHFTLEASGTFVYQGGEIFRFTGDDDVWVFINDRLVIDLGGTHASMSSEVGLDDQAASLGLTLGSEYPIHIFFAERHTVSSNFTIETSIAGLGDCP